jgi:hypothetical protein
MAAKSGEITGGSMKTEKYCVEFVGEDGTWAAIKPENGLPCAWFPTEVCALEYCRFKNSPIRETYDRFKHLDRVLMDVEFDDGGMRRPIQRECWKIIKEILGVEA